MVNRYLYRKNEFIEQPFNIFLLFLGVNMAKTGKYGQWTQDYLHRAVEANRNGGFSLKECMRIYGVSKGTIKRHADDKNATTNKDTSLGRQPIFDQEMPEVLSNPFFEVWAKLFYGFTIIEYRKLAFEVAKND